jgi:signal peptide peptidase SppA
MKSYPFSAARIFGVPLAIHPTKGKVIAKALAGRLGISSVTIQGADGAQMFVDDDDGFAEPVEERGYDVVNGVAVIPVCGTLVHKSASLRPSSGMLGYNAIRHNLMSALNDDSARAVVLDCNSPGGEVSGCFDLVDAIYEVRGDKPITAICDDMAYSACYAIASACDSIVLPRTGGVGSIGVITMHVEYSKALKGAGIEIQIFKYGDRKADGNPYNPLSKEAAASFQADIDSLGELFVDTVARNRGLTTAKVRATQAATYMGAAGVDAGLADAVLAPDEAFRVLLAELG